MIKEVLNKIHFAGLYLVKVPISRSYLIMLSHCSLRGYKLYIKGLGTKRMFVVVAKPARQFSHAMQIFSCLQTVETIKK